MSSRFFNSDSVASNLAHRYGDDDNDLRPWATETYSTSACDHIIFDYYVMALHLHDSFATCADSECHNYELV